MLDVYILIMAILIPLFSLLQMSFADYNSINTLLQHARPNQRPSNSGPSTNTTPNNHHVNYGYTKPQGLQQPWDTTCARIPSWMDMIPSIALNTATSHTASKGFTDMHRVDYTTRRYGLAPCAFQPVSFAVYHPLQLSGYPDTPYFPPDSYVRTHGTPLDTPPTPCTSSGYSTMPQHTIQPNPSKTSSPSTSKPKRKQRRPKPTQEPIQCLVNRNEKPFTCSICNHSFRLQIHLTRHAKHCSAETRIYQCYTCSKKFSHRSTLRSHMNTHTGVTPYMCRECGQEFKDRSTRNKHERTHNVVAKFQCELCDYRSNTMTNIKRHVGVHHPSSV